jgi:predicted metal-binding membrane protein
VSTTTSSPSRTVERLIERDRLVVGLGLLAITGLSWIHLLRMASGGNASDAGANMSAHMAMPGMAMPDMQTWGVADLISLFLMWTVMMVAMMLPSATPTILLVVGTYRRRSGRGARLLTAAFALGYVAAWTAFSAAAATLQLFLHRAALLSGMMAVRSTTVGGAILLVAGIYQWLPIKNACLAHCRSPLGFLTHEWRDGVLGAFIMGLRHGTFCVGCCWALMFLLFAAGVMNLVWVAAIALFVLAEKVVRQGPWFSRWSGVLLFTWGTYVLIASSAPK